MPSPFPKFVLMPVQMGNGMRVNTSHHNCKYSDEIVAKVRELRANGMRTMEIAKLLDVKPSRVSTWTLHPHHRTPAKYIAIRRVRVND